MDNPPAAAAAAGKGNANDGLASLVAESGPAVLPSTDKESSIQENDDNINLATQTAAATQTTTKNNAKGIDIHKAMAILSQRQTHHHNHDHEHRLPPQKETEDTNNNEIACEPQQNHSNSGGQVIDLFAPSPKLEDNNDKAKDNHDNDNLALQSSSLPTQQQQKEQQARLEHEIAQMSLWQQIQVVLRAQEDRVATYRMFDEGLRDALQSGNLTLYPALVAQVTATFAVLSNTVNAVKKNQPQQDIKKDSGLSALLQQLQNHERDKLNATAALHLEQMRHAAAQPLEVQQEQDDRRSASATDALLQEGIASLKQKIAQTVQNINEVMEELQYLKMEAMEEEQQEDSHT